MQTQIISAMTLSILLGTMPVVAGASEPPKAPPLEAFAALPAIEYPQISPDGSAIAYSTRRADGVAAIAVQNVDTIGQEPPTLVGFPTAFRFSVSWANNETLVVTAFLRNPDEPSSPIANEATVHRTFMVDRPTPGRRFQVRQLAPIRNTHYPTGQIVSYLPDDPDHVLMLYSSRDKGASVYKVHVNGRWTQQVVREEREVYNWFADRHGVVRTAQLILQETMTHRFLYRPDSEADYRPVDIVNHEPKEIWGAGFGKHDNLFYFVSRSGADRYAVYRTNLGPTEPPERVFADPTYDVESLIQDRDGTIVGVGYTTVLFTSHFFDPELARIQAEADDLLPGTMERLAAWSEDRRRVVVASQAPGVPTDFHVVDRESGRWMAIGSARPELAGLPLPTRRRVDVIARDGATIPTYLTFPPGHGEDAGPARSLPMVVFPHGGPDIRDDLHFNWIAAFLASRGMVVLQPDFRGSQGYGYAHEAAGRGEFGGLMQDDVTDTVLWATGKGIADPTRICIAGISYGGYAAVMGAVKTPELYRCAIGVNGVYDLVDFREEIRWLGTPEWVNRMFGDDLADIAARSPRRLANRIEDPILLIHGAVDATTVLSQAKNMASALEDAGKPYELVVVPDLYHAIDTTAHRTLLLQHLERFLATHLGP